MAPINGDAIFLKLGFLEVSAFGYVAIIALVVLAALALISQVLKKRSNGR